VDGLISNLIVQRSPHLPSDLAQRQILTNVPFYVGTCVVLDSDLNQVRVLRGSGFIDFDHARYLAAARRLDKADGEARWGAAPQSPMSYTISTEPSRTPGKVTATSSDGHSFTASEPLFTGARYWLDHGAEQRAGPASGRRASRFHHSFTHAYLRCVERPAARRGSILTHHILFRSGISCFCRTECHRHLCETND